MSLVGSAALPTHCDPTSDFLTKVSNYFHVCLPTPLAFVSSLSGILSILSWLFAQLPQIYKNYQLQSTAGISIFFLVEWCLGDATNLLGALFTNQASWQVVVAGYYVFVDVCLVCQYFWYTYTRPWLDGQSLHSRGSSIIDDDDSELINGLSPINSNFSEEEGNFGDDVHSMSKKPDHFQSDLPKKAQQQRESRGSNRTQSARMSSHGLGIYSEKATQPTSAPVPAHVQVNLNSNPFIPPRTVVYGTTLYTLASAVAASPISQPPPSALSQSYDFEVAGTVLAWTSTVLYLFSRLPQLYKNWSRKSTSGLSPLLFAAAFSGNLFYSTSLLTSPYAWRDFGPYGGHGWAGPEGSNRREWVLAALPFFLGAFGVLALDAFMGVQFRMYGERDTEVVVKIRDSQHGEGRWEVVSGYMRGWVPALGPERKVSVAEGSQLLSRSRVSEYGTL